MYLLNRAHRKASIYTRQERLLTAVDGTRTSSTLLNTAFRTSLPKRCPPTSPNIFNSTAVECWKNKTPHRPQCLLWHILSLTWDACWISWYPWRAKGGFQTPACCTWELSCELCVLHRFLTGDAALHEVIQTSTCILLKIISNTC